ncbi:MAG: TetR/AcrR family transcriptional regulator [Oscillospiraceae bacterium]|nr:TetR/AcrR family transcriptional regulator [Oscillospiraceae bacterium]
MPKIIDGARDGILRTAEGILFERGYTGFTLRAVAAACGMAVGTIYNYFPSKNVLIASIMAKDWFAALASMDAGVRSADSLAQGLRGIYGEIGDFAARYEPVWNQFNGTAQEPGITPDRHVLLRTQLAERLETLLARFAPGHDPASVPLFAETVLAAALQKDISFGALADAAARLYGQKQEIN